MDLLNVRKPSQYIGNEFNSLHKDWDKCDFRVAISYPDLYEIGMSNYAIQILYSLINEMDSVLCERVFAPMPDMEGELKTQSLNLKALESQKSLDQFDLIGFSLGHELNYTNVLNILNLGSIPLHAKDRTDKDPIIMGGGPCAYNPAPIEDFFDFFVIGEAEEIMPKLIDSLRNSRNLSRLTRLQQLAPLPGIYIPALHNNVTRCYIKDLNSIPILTKPIVPFTETVHDRAVLEIMRGCKWGCKFCQAGWTSKPVRERDKEQLIKAADEILKNTGYDELSLISLSSSDHSQIEDLAKTLAVKYEKDRINISLPSMRTNSFTVNLANEVQRVRPSGLTLAPEAGTQRLRDYIGKNMTEEQIFDSVKAAFSSGISSIKLYFMIGLPTETEEDLLSICQLAKTVSDIGKSFGKRINVVINLATFVPKPHTPFQWEEQINIEQSLAKQRFIKQHSSLVVRWHKAEASYIEGIFSRGDTKLVVVLEKAYLLGCRLDAWDEHFKFDLWLQAFKECDIDPNEYLKARDRNTPLPWDNIKC